MLLKGAKSFNKAQLFYTDMMLAKYVNVSLLICGNILLRMCSQKTRTLKGMKWFNGAWFPLQ